MTTKELIVEGRETIARYLGPFFTTYPNHPSIAHSLTFLVVVVVAAKSSE